MTRNSKTLSTFVKMLLVIVGIISLLLGIIGIVVPLLPATPFFLLSAACFIRGSDRLYQWLINHKILGKYIRNYLIHKSIPLKTKIVSISLLWIGMLYSTIFITNSTYIRILLAIVAIAVTIHISHFNTLKN